MKVKAIVAVTRSDSFVDLRLSFNWRSFSSDVLSCLDQSSVRVSRNNEKVDGFVCVQLGLVVALYVVRDLDPSLPRDRTSFLFTPQSLVNTTS